MYALHNDGSKVSPGRRVMHRARNEKARAQLLSLVRGVVLALGGHAKRHGLKVQPVMRNDEGSEMCCQTRSPKPGNGPRFVCRCHLARRMTSHMPGTQIALNAWADAGRTVWKINNSISGNLSYCQYQTALDWTLPLQPLDGEL